MLQQYTIPKRNTNDEKKAMFEANGYLSRFFDKLVQQFYSHNGSNQSFVDPAKLPINIRSLFRILLKIHDDSSITFQK